MATDAQTSASPGGDEGGGAQPLSGCFVRLFWMVAGNAGLFLIAVAFFKEPAWTISWKDGLYWTLVGTMILLRYVDVSRLGGTTARGEPATRADLVRYSLGLVGFAALLWIVSHSLKLLA